MLLLVIGLTSAQYAVADYEKNKVVFTDANFDTEIKKYDSIFIEFYNPRWPLCQRFKPVFDNAA